MKIMAWLTGGVAALLAALSFAAIGSSGFHLAGGDVVSAFDSLMRTLFAPLESPLDKFVRWAGERLGAGLRLHGHWKYAFVLLWLYFLALARIWWGAGGRGAAIFSVAWGGLVALASALVFGSVEIDPLSRSFLANAIIGSVPLTAYALFTIGIGAWATIFLGREGRGWFAAFNSWTRGDLGLTAIGAIALGFALVAIHLTDQEMPNAGLMLAGGFVGLLAFYLIGVGVRDVRKLRGDGESWFGAFARMQSPRIGMLVVSSLGGAAAVIAWSGRF